MRLRLLRKNENLTMKELGAIVGVSESTISLYETGKREPDYDMLNKFADYFGVTVDYILGRDDIKAEKPAPKTESELNDAFAKDFNRLTPEEQKMIHAQIKGLLSNRK